MTPPAPLAVLFIATYQIGSFSCMSPQWWAGRQSAIDDRVERQVEWQVFAVSVPGCVGWRGQRDAVTLHGGVE